MVTFNLVEMMKRIFKYLMFAGAGVLSAACTQELVDDTKVEEGEVITIAAGVDNGADTKVTFADDDANRKVVINWKESDEAFTAYIDGTKVDFAQASAPSDGKAYFSGTYDGDITEDAVVHAVYPLTANEVDKVDLYFNGQSGKERDERHTHMYAHSTLGEVKASGLTFRHLTSILKVTMSFPAGVSGTVKDIQFFANDLISQARINFKTETPGVSIYASGSVSVEGEVQIEGGKAVVYLHTLPSTLAGLRVTATVDGTAYAAIIGGRSGGKAMEAGMQYNVSANVLDAADIYATVGGTGDGSSWESATTLTNALALAGEGSTVHVAAGTYVPDSPLPYAAHGLNSVNHSDKTVYNGYGIFNNITVIGGYPENPTAGAVADPSVNKTVLDGNSTSYHVVFVASQKTEGKQVVINGITVQNGKANASGNSDNTNIKLNMLNDKGQYEQVQFDGNKGGGIAVMNSAVKLVNAVVTANNSRYDGAGIYALNSDLEFDGSSLVSNTTGSKGGALYAQNSSVAADGCDISKNKGKGGAAVYLVNSNGEFDNCAITSNDGNNDNGNVYLENTVSGTENSLTFDGCIVKENSNCSNGTFLYAYAKGGNVDVNVINTAIINNVNDGKSRNIFLRNNNVSHLLSANFVNTTFSGNKATYGSAIAYGSDKFGAKLESNIISCTITRNSSTHPSTTGNHGAIFIEGKNDDGDFDIKVYNTILSGNTWDGAGEGAADDVWSKTTSSEVKYYSSIVGDKCYNASGAVDASVSAFNASSMLAALAQVGNTWGCKLVSGNNPAVGNGSSVAELEALAEGPVTAAILAADQEGKTRTDAKVMGAIVTRQ